MGTIVETTVPADEFALKETSASLTDCTFRLEQVVAQDPNYILPFIWVSCGDRDDFENALTDDSSVKNFEFVTDLGEKWLYQMDWVDRIETLVRVIVAEDAVILAAYGTDEAWHLQFLFLEREAIPRVQDHCEEAGLAFDVRRIYDHANGAMGTRGLTDHQHYTLTLALERGYYDDPRGIDATDLAIELDVTPHELTERLRSAHGALVTNSVSIGIPPRFGDAASDG